MLKMNAEEEKYVKRLLSPESTEAQKGTALKWMAKFFEQDYILDLKRSKTSLDALEDFSDDSGNDPKLIKRAQRLLKKYQN